MPCFFIVQNSGYLAVLAEGKAVVVPSAEYDKVGVLLAAMRIDEIEVGQFGLDSCYKAPIVLGKCETDRFLDRLQSFFAVDRPIGKQLGLFDGFNDIVYALAHAVLAVAG